VKKKCNEVQNIEYWLRHKPSIVLKIANTKEREYLI
jgi:hypothetical protein